MLYLASSDGLIYQGVSKTTQLWLNPIIHTLPSGVGEIHNQSPSTSLMWLRYSSESIHLHSRLFSSPPCQPALLCHHSFHAGLCHSLHAGLCQVSLHTGLCQFSLGIGLCQSSLDTGIRHSSLNTDVCQPLLQTSLVESLLLVFLPHRIISYMVLITFFIVLSSLACSPPLILMSYLPPLVSLIVGALYQDFLHGVLVYRSYWSIHVPAFCYLLNTRSPVGYSAVVLCCSPHSSGHF